MNVPIVFSFFMQEHVYARLTCNEHTVSYRKEVNADIWLNRPTPSSGNVANAFETLPDVIWISRAIYRSFAKFLDSSTVFCILYLCLYIPTCICIF